MPIISPTIISPFKRKGGTSWSAYWATLISATVENAAPTHVVLTFPTAQTSLTDTDFTIAGFTISSASWAGAVLTLVLSEAVMIYDGNLAITFVLTGEIGIVTNNVNTDADAIAIYDSQDLSTITKDGSDFISLWEDKLGSGRDLVQATGSNQPLWSLNGITFDGIDNWIRAQPFDFDQPIQLYTVMNVITKTIGSVFFSSAYADYFSNRIPSGDYLTLYSGAYIGNAPYTFNTVIIYRSFANGLNSKIQVNNNAAITGDAGARGLRHGIHLGSQNSVAEPPTVSSFANVLYKEIIVRKVTASVSEETRIYNYLANKHGFATI